MAERQPVATCEPVGTGEWEVRQGDCVYSIAAKTGHLWTTIWEHPQNEGLRKARRDPGILLPGDRVFVPKLAPKSVLLASGRRHRIVIDGQTVTLRIRMSDEDGKPLAKAAYRLEVAGQQLQVTTDEGGCLEAPVPSQAEAATLVEVATSATFTLHLGHMDPSGSPGAIRKRLANLGYDLAEPEGAIDEQVHAILDQFVEDAKLDAGVEWEELVRRLEARDPWHS